MARRNGTQRDSVGAVRWEGFAAPLWEPTTGVKSESGLQTQLQVQVQVHERAINGHAVVRYGCCTVHCTGWQPRRPHHCCSSLELVVG